MNQILYEDVASKKQVDIKNIIRFFSIAMIVFGVITIGFGTYGIIKLVQRQGPVSTNPPSIETSVVNSNYVRIAVTHDKPIDKITYSWNNGEEVTISGRNSKFKEELIEMPEGRNVLNVWVTDNIGIQGSYTNTYDSRNSEIDIDEPIIDLSTAGSKIHIIATDENEIAYITYRWNEEEETKIEPTDDNKKIETDVDVIKGENTLTVVAVDAYNNMATKTKICDVKTKPTIHMPRQNREYLTIYVTDDVGLDYVEYELNGKKYKWISQQENEKECEYRIDLELGDNYIIINARNKEGIDATTFYGKCTYSLD